MADMYITADAANAILRDMVQAQTAEFGAQQQVIVALHAETCGLIAQTRDDVNRSLIDNKAAAEAHVVDQVGALRTQTQDSVNHVDGKLQEMRDLLLQHDRTQNEPGQRIRNSSTSSNSLRREFRPRSCECTKK